MFDKSRLVALLSVAAFGSAKLVFHESRVAPPSGFTSQGAAPIDQRLELRIGLASSNIHGLREKLLSVSTPGNVDFRRWLSPDEISAFVQPSSNSLTAFSSFAKANNLTTTSVSLYGDWVSISTTVGQANTLFGTNYHNFGHSSLSVPLLRTLSVYLPPELVGHIDVIHPTTSFGATNRRSSPLTSAAARPSPIKRHVAASCNSTITPACLQELYGIPSTPATQKSNTLLVTQYEGEAGEIADVSAFLAQFRPDIDRSTTFTLLTVDNGTNPQSPTAASDGESDLDLEYTIGIATGVPVSLLANGANTTLESDWANALIDSAAFVASLSSPPLVVTTSYGDDEPLYSPSLARKLCDMYAALGTRGVSVVYASGDGGVHGLHDNADECTTNTFVPVFPASCPFVTAVGSTVGVNPERAINFTGGGFSNLFAIPHYQAAAVSKFKQTIPPDFAGVFNASGRGYPDVATQGWNFEVVVGGKMGLAGGTSASAPTFAAIAALINDRLVAAGKPVLGFLNPWLYSKASGAFTDVTVGKNPGFHCSDSTVAFSAVKGWDPLTGFGTPVFPKLLAAAMV